MQISISNIFCRSKKYQYRNRKPLKNWMNDMIPCKGNEDKTIKDLNKEVRERYEKYKKKFLSPNKNFDKPKLNKKNELPKNYQMLEKERN